MLLSSKVPELTQSRLKELLQYLPETGEFIAIAERTRVEPGQILGTYCKHSGYILIKLEQTQYYAHRLAIYYMTGVMPTEIDHIDRDKSNNRFNNLRICTRSQNTANRGIQSNNSTGHKGIQLRKTKTGFRYRACVAYNGIKRLKYFSIPNPALQENILNLAIAWLSNAREELHGEYTNHGR